MAFIGSGIAPPVAVEVVRGGRVESVHRAHIAVTDPAGELTMAAGDPTVRVYPRSALKPVLASIMVAHGFVPEHQQAAALAASSHSGEDFHQAGVTAMLQAVGLTPAALHNTPDWPFDEDAKVAWIAAGRPKTSLAANCSGKHAAMLSTCVANGWSTDDYLDPSHPLPVALASGVAAAVGDSVSDAGTDGCGAAIWAVPLVGLARAFGALVTASSGSPAAVIADGMRAAPEYVGGTRRDATALMRAFPGLLAKDGADGVYAAALPDGRGVAIKIEDGAARARPAAIAGTLRALGLDPQPLAAIADWEKVLGGGVPAGRMRPAVTLTAV